MAVIAAGAALGPYSLLEQPTGGWGLFGLAPSTSAAGKGWPSCGGAPKRVVVGLELERVGHRRQLPPSAITHDRWERRAWAPTRSLPALVPRGLPLLVHVQ